MRRELSDDLHMLCGVAQVLDQGPPAGDVQDLCAAADRENRNVALHSAAAKRNLEAIALGLEADRLGVRLRAVARGVEVRTSGENQRVEDVEELSRV